MEKLFRDFRILPLWIRITVVIYSLCLAGAAYNHVADIGRGGFLPYTKAPLFLNLYWTSLTLWDPLAVILLFFSLRRGIYLTWTIMITDIAVNIYGTYAIWDLTVATNVFLQMQIAFGVFVFATGPIILKSLNRKKYPLQDRLNRYKA